MKYITNNKSENLKINPNNSYLVIDFDKTITAKESLDSWAASANPDIVGTQIVEEMDALCEKYEPIELSHTISKSEKEKHMEKWYGDCMNLYYKYGLTKENLIKSIKQSKLLFRKGAKEFLQKCFQNNIPVIILSAGIGNVIEQFLKENNCYFENMYIISNFIEFNTEGKMKKFNQANMIHTLNKTMEGHLPKQILQKLQDKEYAILIGDLVEDEQMIEKNKWNKTLKIGILNKKIEENLEVYQNHFDIVLTEEDATFEIIDKIVF